MTTSQNPVTSRVFIDFIPAELRENKTWEVIYYCRNPFTGELVRKRNRVKPLKSKIERRKLAKRMILDINKKLEQGWSPWITEGNSKSFTLITEAIDIFLRKCNDQKKKGDLRPDTFRTYKSFTNILIAYISENDHSNTFLGKMDESFVVDYLDYIYYERNNSSRTRNNHLKFIITLCEFLIQRKYLALNPAISISRMSESVKKRMYIPPEARMEIFRYFKRANPAYLVLCLTCYYCLVRRTELTKLRVSDVFIDNGIIYVETGISKNKRSKPVTIPRKLLPYLKNHLKEASDDHYLFGNNGFLPGPLKLRPNRITDHWGYMRNALKLKKEYQWYSLKDSGITDLLKAGVPTIDVKNQARHHSITQTEAYIPKEILVAEKSIQNLDLGFI